MSTLIIIISLIALIIVQRTTKSVLFAIIGSITTIIIFRFDSTAILESFKTPILDLSLYKLLGTVFLIYLFSNALDLSGDAKKFAASSKALFDDRTSMAFMPMMIGFLPMPGGAMFTAPIVKMIGDEENFANDYMMVVNYWFRHVVEFFWPVYPAIFLLTTMAGIEMGAFSISLLPVFLIATLAGWLMLNGFRLPKIKKVSKDQLKGLWILIFIVCTGVLILAFKVEGYLALGINIGAYFLFRRRYFFKSLLKSFKKWDVMLLLFMFFVYKNYLINVSLTSDIAAELNNVGLNIHLLTLILPILIGMSTGITQSAIGITAPLLLSIGANPALLYFSAVAGVLLSPVHLCVVLTGNYFKSDLLKVFGRILPLIIVTGVAVFILFVF